MKRHIERVYPDQGRREILQKPRNNDERFDPWSMLDLRFQKSFNIYKTWRLDAIIDRLGIT
ncbi:MAG: hypothetical protein WBE11_10650 [Candidatus Aminicenantaceae bacterium]|jgi:hypothetical protein